MERSWIGLHAEVRSNKTRCLILACGNTLRGDDGVGPWLAAWAEERFKDESGVRVVSRQQWTPDLAEEIAAAESVLFIDCSIAAAPGSVSVAEVRPAAAEGRGTHHQNASELLSLAEKLYASLPRASQLLTVGAQSIELGEEFSEAITAALPETCRLIEETLSKQLGNNYRTRGA
jgi:hydrogenase maturation protease